MKNKKTTVYDCSIIELNKHHANEGNLTVVENNKTIPFEVKRLYYLYDVPGGEVRGSHAYRETEEFIVALSGSFDVVIDDGKVKQIFSLNRSYYGLYVPKMMWRQMQNFSTNSLALIVTNTEFNRDDYIYDYDLFLKEKSNEK